jgi:hypothetical protein
MTDIVVEAAIAEALIKLKPWLKIKPRWWQITLENEREAALRDYLFVVLQTALARMIGEQWLPREAEAMARLDATVERAIAAAEHPDVAAAAARYRETLRDRWRAGYLAEVAMRATNGCLCYGPPARREHEQAGGDTAAEFSAGAAGGEPDECVEQKIDTAARERLIEERRQLLQQYKAATGASNRAIYEAREHSARKPAFYAWLKGDLPPNTAAAQSLERFLRENKPPRRGKSESE